MTSEPASLAMFVVEDRFEPCRVCGEPSSGWHCGAITCEACKKFFLRSINGEDTKYKCIRNQDCVIMRTTRTQCQFCRFQKCKEVGMTINENPNNPTVAEIFKGFPCCVCKASSSGVHFGAITCEGCKGFFRRSIKERAPERYRCLENGDCEISAATRNMCRHCRFQKCLKAGMAAQNSRIGRQSNLFKHNIIEWQSKGIIPSLNHMSASQRKLKRVKSEMITGSSLDHVNGAYFSEQSSIHVYDMKSIHMMQSVENNSVMSHSQIANQLSNNQTSYPHNFNTNNPITNNYGFNMNLPTSWSSNYPNVQQNDSNTNFLNKTQVSTSSHLFHVPSAPSLLTLSGNTSAPVVNGIEDSLETKVKDLIKVIIQSYNSYLCPIVEIMKSDFYLKQNQASSVCNSKSYYTEFHANRVSSTINKVYLFEMIGYMRFYARKFASFSENIPGLSQLTSLDKEELIKCSIHSVVLLALQRKCEHFNYFNCEPSKLEQFLKIFPVFARTGIFMKSINEKFEKFKLDDKEYALYSALLVISTASKYLKDYDKIMEIREDIGTALRLYMFARRNEEITCDEILLMLVYFRKFNSNLQKGLTRSYYKLIELEPSLFDDYPFIQKVFLPNSTELSFILNSN